VHQENRTGHGTDELKVPAMQRRKSKEVVS